MRLFCTSSVSAALFRSRIPSSACLIRLMNFLVKRPKELSYRQGPTGVRLFPDGESALDPALLHFPILGIFCGFDAFPETGVCREVVVVA